MERGTKEVLIEATWSNPPGEGSFSFRHCPSW